MTKAKEIQKAFLTRVKSVVPANVSFVDELADLLNTSNDSAYRRLRGDTLLSIDEIASICSHFKVPFETQTQSDTAVVTFNYFKLNNAEQNFVHWLTSMAQHVKHISTVPNSSITYAADDIPIWHHFNHPELAAFKLFYWLKNIVNEPAYAGKKFNMNLISPNLIDTAHRLLTDYDLCKSTEIWSDDTVNSTIKQVEYFWESGYFEDLAQAHRICDFLIDEITLLMSKTEWGSKTIDGAKNFTFYHSELMIGNNSIIVDLNGNKIAYLSNNTFNMMTTTTPDFVNENESWINNLISKSVQISGTSEKQRNKFFNGIILKLQQLKARIQ